MMIPKLVTIISLMCSFDNPFISKEEKIQCMEHYTNCVLNMDENFPLEKRVKLCTLKKN